MERAAHGIGNVEIIGERVKRSIEEVCIMSNIVAKIKEIPELTAIKGCTVKQVVEAQEALNMVFPEEYIDYVRAFGCIDFIATEWTGLNIKGRLNTVEATEAERSINSAFPRGFFVLEDLAMDAKKVIVNEKGEVFLLQWDSLSKLCGSISEYLDLCRRRA